KLALGLLCCALALLFFVFVLGLDLRLFRLHFCFRRRCHFATSSLPGRKGPPCGESRKRRERDPKAHCDDGTLLWLTDAFSLLLKRNFLPRCSHQAAVLAQQTIPLSTSKYVRSLKIQIWHKRCIAGGRTAAWESSAVPSSGSVWEDGTAKRREQS